MNAQPFDQVMQHSQHMLNMIHTIIELCTRAPGDTLETLALKNTILTFIKSSITEKLPYQRS